MERLKVLGIDLETAARLPASKGRILAYAYKVELGNYLPLRADRPKPLTITVAFYGKESVKIRQAKKIRQPT